MKEPCPKGQHEKVYAGYVLCSYPGQRPWICRKCLTEGVEREVPQSRGMEYNELMRKKAELK